MSGAPQCRGCHAIIRWVKTRAGRPMPVDPERLEEWLVEEEQVVLSTNETPNLRWITLVTLEGDTVKGIQGSVITPGARRVLGYIPHWVSCPQREQFRRAKA